MFLKILVALLLLAHGLGNVMAPQSAFVPPGAFPRGSAAVLGPKVDDRESSRQSALTALADSPRGLRHWDLWPVDWTRVVAPGPDRLRHRVHCGGAALVERD
jgi:hypothetical protein